MEIARNLQHNITERYILGTDTGGEHPNQDDTQFLGFPKDEAAVVINISSGKMINKPDLKEAASEMLIKQPTMGEFKDKKGLEEATDAHIGPDIRYALKSDNPDFLKRILWGPLTVGEFREVKHRLTEIERRHESSPNLLQGKIIDVGMLQEKEFNGKDTSKGSVDGPKPILNISV